jgi:F420-dependent oxidoreductase-like protein
MSMKLASQINYAHGFKEAADTVIELEKAGLDVVWVPEAYGFDAVSQMSYIAAKTERLEIASGILPIYSRTPALLAQTAAGLDSLSGGRFMLGLGASGPQVVEGWHGIAYDRPLGRTREIVEICRLAWNRELLVHDGIYTIPLDPETGTGLGKPLKMILRPVRPTIPVWMAALGDKNVELAAEIADGWLPFLFLPEKANDVWGGALGRGAAKRSDALGPLGIAGGGVAIIGDDVDQYRDQVRRDIALYVGGMGAKGHNFYNELATRYGFEKEAETVQDLFLSGKRAEAEAAVPDELIEKTSLIGSAGFVKDRIAAYKDAGVTILTITPVGDSQRSTVEQIREWTD